MQEEKKEKYINGEIYGEKNPVEGTYKLTMKRVKFRDES